MRSRASPASASATRCSARKPSSVVRTTAISASARATASSNGTASMRKSSAPAATGSLSRTPTSITRPETSAVTAIMCAFT
jgi:hypothetical protein